MSESRSSPKRIKAAERRLHILRQRRDGVPVSRIAEEQNVSRRRVRQIVDAELDRVRYETAEAARDLKTEMLSQLEELRAAVWGQATGEAPDLNAVDKALKVLSQKAKLLGLDAPQKILTGRDAVDEMSDSELREEARRHGIPVAG